MVTGLILAKMFDFLLKLGPGYSLGIDVGIDSCVVTVYQPSDTLDTLPFHVHIEPGEDPTELLTLVMSFLERKVNSENSSS